MSIVSCARLYLSAPAMHVEHNLPTNHDILTTTTRCTTQIIKSSACSAILQLHDNVQNA